MFPLQISDRTYPRQYNANSKLLGPPRNWIGRAPTCTYQLNILYLPLLLNEKLFMQFVSRFGIVFQFKLMIGDSTLKLKSQGIGYLRYTTLIDALAAKELLNRFFLDYGSRLSVSRYFGNRSLDVAPIPNSLGVNALLQELRCVFPNMMSLTRSTKATATIHFESYEAALWAKQRFARQKGMLGDNELNVTWSTVTPMRAFRSKSTFIVRGINNLDFKQNLLNEIKILISPMKIQMLRYLGNQLVVSFDNPADASHVFFELQKSIFDKNFSILWARNSPKCWSMMHVSDFCAELRMICIANGWRIPIILFGRNFHKNNIQYGSILLSDENGINTAAFLMEVITTKITDIQSTMCEVAVDVVNKINGLPKEHLVFKVTYQYGHEVFKLKTLHETPYNHEDRIRDWRSIHEMASTLSRLLAFSDELILSKYKISFLASTQGFIQEHVLPNCCSIYPKYRNKPALVHNLNDTEIVLALQRNTSSFYLPELGYVEKFNDNTIPLKWNTKTSDFHIYDFIHAGSCRFYHPDQKIHDVPVWIHGHTYRRSTKNYISL